MALHGQRVATAELAHRLEVSRASVYRVIEDARAKTEVKVKGRSASVYRILEAA
jgi:DNA-binding transcriptional regulator LsrR (DeoR family)